MRFSEKAHSRRDTLRQLLEARLRPAEWAPEAGTVEFAAKAKHGIYNYRFETSAQRLESHFMAAVRMPPADAANKALRKTFRTALRAVVNRKASDRP